MTRGRLARWRRIATEKRAIVWPLAAVLVVNAALFAFVVYPLRLRVSSAERRAQAAEADMRAAERERQAARATLAGKERAQEELARFYANVLPSGFPGARRVLYLRISQLAREAGLQYKNQTFEEEQEKDRDTADVRKLTATIMLEGSYENARRFIYSLETAPDFVIIENVTLSTRNQVNAPLVLKLVLSTYYRPGGPAA